MASNISPATRRRWSMNIDHVLNDAQGRAMFRRFLEKNYPQHSSPVAMDTLDFWIEYNNICETNGINFINVFRRSPKEKVRSLATSVEQRNVNLDQATLRLLYQDGNTSRATRKAVLDAIRGDPHFNDACAAMTNQLSQ